MPHVRDLRDHRRSHTQRCRRFVEAAVAGSLGEVRLPSMGCPASAEEHASKVRKMRARMHLHACTQTGAEAAAQVHFIPWSFTECHSS